MRSPRCVLGLALAAGAACSSKPAAQRPAPAAQQPPVPPSLERLGDGDVISGFSARAVYLDDADAPIGARFVHQRTGFTFDYLQIESAPQGFIWVNTFPTSDKGEPHTQEHLLLGKGAMGRFVSSLESMALVSSSAFTAQWRTAYHFHTIAGPAVFWDVLEHRFDALLHPDYTDEEIRREVRNFGVAAAPDGSLRLEEKGTVYNEMVRSFESSWRIVYRAAHQTIYGDSHPLALSSGGEPSAIREMTPEDIRAFHARNYHLGNMGMVGSFPRALALGDVLGQLGAILDRVQPAAQTEGRVVTTEADLPAPAPRSATALVEVAGYPHASASTPGPLMLVWPASRDLDPAELTMLQLFLSAFAGDESTPLYKRFIDNATRSVDLGATDVWSWASSELGQPVYVGFSNVPVDQMTPERIEAVRAQVLAELRAIAEAEPGDPALVALEARLRSRLVQTRRSLAKFLNSPPGFGARGTGSGWMDHLHELAAVPGFRKSLTMKPALAAIEGVLDEPGNPWRSRLGSWGLLERPHAVAGRADPSLLERADRERAGRIEAKLAELARAYGTADPAETIQRYRDDYDAQTRALEEAARGEAMPRFIDAPPMTLDDTLRYRTGEVAGVPMVASDFDSMTSGQVGLALGLDAVPPQSLPHLALLPVLLTEVGIYRDGEAIAPDAMKERLRREVLGVSMSYDTNFRTGRAELMVRGSGNDAAETERALAWMEQMLLHADWRPENLPRIRDVVDQAAARLRTRMQGAEEGWVDDPPAIWLYQERPLLAHTGSFLTRAHDAHRLRWLLMDAGDGRAAARTAAFFDALSSAGERATRDELRALAGALAASGEDRPKVSARLRRHVRSAGALSEAGRAIAREAGDDLAQLLADLPEGSLAADWAYLCRQMRHDLLVPPAEVLAELGAVRDLIARRPHARLYAVGAPRTHEAIAPALQRLVDALPELAAPRQTYAATPFIRERLRARLGDDAASAVFVGLVNPNTQGGVFVNSAPSAGYAEREPSALLDYLAGNLFTGGGAHSMFMKTWAAGLAYSNGLRISLAGERVAYYAERCPDLTQTLSFVIDELRAAKPAPHLAEYAIAEAFSSRVASSYEGRAAAIARDLADGTTPDLVRGFRERLLALRGEPNLADTLFARMEAIYGRVLPGYGPASRDVEGGTFFVIGPLAQLERYQAYLRRAEGEDARLFALYPRDFWWPLELTGAPPRPAPR